MRTVVVLALFCLPFIGFGQGFVQTSDQLFPSNSSIVRWADLDNDDDLDLMYYGFEPSHPAESIPYGTYVYENINGTFTLRPTDLPQLRASDYALGDYDNDGDLDVLLSGITPENTDITKIFKNNGGFTFEETYSFLGLSSSEPRWVDLDNDSDLDFVEIGRAHV